VGAVQIRRPFKLFAREELIRNLSFRDTPVKEVIAEIARQGGLNVLIDKSVTGKVTGELKDVTLNEAMDSVLAAAGLQSRTVDNNAVIVGTQNAMVQLGLNRPLAKAFKLSYADPFDVAMLLFTSVFNRGFVPDFNASMRRKVTTTDKEDNRKESDERNETELRTGTEANRRSAKTMDRKAGVNLGVNEDAQIEETNLLSRLDAQRTLRGSARIQLQEGTGSNNAATDPGSMQIRAYQSLPTDFTVEQNGGGAIVIPDVKNRQVIVVGTAEDIATAEQSIHLIDRRPRQVHIQASLIEITNQGIRQLGASLGLQGSGASGNTLGNPGSPLITPLPGLGTSQNQTGQGFIGVIGNILPFQVANPSTGGTVAAVTNNLAALSGFNFLTLSKQAGGHANIATFPKALDVSVNALLQNNKAKIIANPSVVVTDNTETLITIADEVLHKVTSTVSLSVVSNNVELTKAGVFLNVLPRVTEDGFVMMRLRPTVSAPLALIQIAGVVVTPISYREIMTQEVRVKDGQTLSIGGLFREQENAQLAKIPYLSETPVLGALFRNSLKARNRSELLLLITPKVVEEDPPAISDSGAPKQM